MSGAALYLFLLVTTIFVTYVSVFLPAPPLFDPGLCLFLVPLTSFLTSNAVIFFSDWRCLPLGAPNDFFIPCHLPRLPGHVSLIFARTSGSLWQVSCYAFGLFPLISFSLALFIKKPRPVAQRCYFTIFFFSPEGVDNLRSTSILTLFFAIRFFSGGDRCGILCDA